MQISFLKTTFILKAIIFNQSHHILLFFEYIFAPTPLEYLHFIAIISSNLTRSLKKLEINYIVVVLK